MLKSLKYIVLINGLLFASELKTPGEFLGYELGDYFTCLLYTSDAADE